MWVLLKPFKCFNQGVGVLDSSLGRTQKLDIPSDGDHYEETFDGEVRYHLVTRTKWNKTKPWRLLAREGYTMRGSFSNVSVYYFS